VPVWAAAVAAAVLSALAAGWTWLLSGRLCLQQQPCSVGRPAVIHCICFERGTVKRLAWCRGSNADQE
jgi:hypothetical protein